MAAYLATRQWVRAVRTWIADEPFWARAQRYASNLSALRHDVSGAFNISWQAGRWAGEGGVCTPSCGADSGAGGSLLGLDVAVKAYFLERGRTIFRRTFERIAMQISADNPPAVPLSAVPVQDSRGLQAQTQFVRARVLRIRSVGFGGLGDPGPDGADMYARATIAGQRYTSRSSTAATASRSQALPPLHVQQGGAGRRSLQRARLADPRPRPHGLDTLRPILPPPPLEQTIRFPARLAAGAQETRAFAGTCAGPLATAVADSGGTVDESDESNNQLTAPPRLC